MRLYSVTVSDFRMFRTPQEELESFDVRATDADDAVRIAGHNHNFPLAELKGAEWHYRTFHSIEAREERTA